MYCRFGTIIGNLGRQCTPRETTDGAKSLTGFHLNVPLQTVGSVR